MQPNQQLSASNVNNLLQSPFNSSRFNATSNQNLLASNRTPSTHSTMRNQFNPDVNENQFKFFFNLKNYF